MSSSGPERDRRVRDVFDAAAKLPRDGRAEFVRRACANEPELRDHVLALLAHDESGPIPFDPLADARRIDEYIGRTRARISKQPAERYVELRRADQGGMGAILYCWDRALQRLVAMKVARGEDLRGTPDFEEPRPATLARLMREAEIAACLKHPAIVPLHELTELSSGRIGVTMHVVDGHDFARVVGAATRDPRKLPLLLSQLERVCRGIAYAHSHGVVHRDLKPRNVMIGAFDAVYVIDWGLARVVDAQRFRAAESGAREMSADDVDLDALIGAAAAIAEDGVDLSGDVVGGTAQYMSPEQARGERDAVGYASDIYGAGAMLYEILAGDAPYASRDGRRSGDEMRALVKAGPPRPLAELAPNAPHDVVAICERAMQRAPGARYASMLEMADDLRRVLDGYAPIVAPRSAWRDLRYWVKRNRELASALAAAAVLMLVGVAAWGRNVVLGADREHLIDERALLSAVDDEIEELEIIPGNIARFDARLEQLERLRGAGLAAENELRTMRERGRLDERKTLARRYGPLESRATMLGKLLPSLRNTATRAKRSAEMNATLDWFAALWQPEFEHVQNVLACAREWDYAAPRADPSPAAASADTRQIGTDDARIEWANDKRVAAVAIAAHQLYDAEVGLRDRLAKRRELAATLEQRSRGDARWAACIEEIGDRARAPEYDGLKLVAQLGLVPLRRDPHSRLWEFWHVLSGEEPSIGADGEYRTAPDDGVVLVLVPGCKHVLGSSADPDAPNYSARISERSELEVELAPYFLAKCELTQAQWQRMHGDWPSTFWAGQFQGAQGPVRATHPVESISIEDAQRELASFGLRLPTEAQWEHAARADDATLRRCGADASAALRMLNCDDTALRKLQAEHVATADGDGYSLTAPVASYPASPLGLHDLLGNVSEWCDGDWTNSYSTTGTAPEVTSVDRISGRLSSRLPGKHVCRGGNFATTVDRISITQRFGLDAGRKRESIGVRAARQLDR